MQTAGRTQWARRHQLGEEIGDPVGKMYSFVGDRQMMEGNKTG